MVSKGISFWRVLLKQQSARFPFFTKIVVLLLLFTINTYFSAHIPQYTIIQRLLLILPWYVTISLMGSLIRMALIHAYLKRNDYPAEVHDNFTIAVNRFSFVIVHVVFFFVLLYLLGIHVTQFFTSISIFAVALVLIFRDFITNFISGTVVMFSRTFRIGNYVKVGEFKGRISDITFMAVEMITDLGDVVHIPNGTILSKEVTDFSRRDQKQIYIEFVLEKQHFERVEGLEERLKAAVDERYADYLTKKGVKFQVEKIEKESMTVSVRVNVARYSYDLEQSIKKHLSKVVLAFISEHRDKPSPRARR